MPSNPINNEEAQAFVASNGYKVERLPDGQTKITRYTDGTFEAVTWCNPDEYLAIAEHALAARHLPVSGDNAEAARAEAERRYPVDFITTGGSAQKRHHFIAGAEWQASQPREAAPSDIEAWSELEEGLSEELELGGDASTLVARVREWMARTSQPREVEVTALSAEDRGIIIDALIQHRDHALGRKAINSESTSNERADTCVRLIRVLGDPALAALGGGE